MFFLSRGEITLKSKDIPIGKINDGVVFGHGCLLKTKSRLVYEVTSNYALVLQIRSDDLLRILKDEPEQNCLESFKALEDARDQYLQSIQFLKQLENVGNAGNKRQGNIRARHRQGFIKSKAIALLGAQNIDIGKKEPQHPSLLSFSGKLSLGGKSFNTEDLPRDGSESPILVSTEALKPAKYIDALIALRKSYASDTGIAQQSGSFSDLGLSISQISNQFREEEDFQADMPPVKNIIHQADNDYFKEDRNHQLEDEALNRSYDEIHLGKYHEEDHTVAENNESISTERSTIQNSSTLLHQEIQAIEVDR